MHTPTQFTNVIFVYYVNIIMMMLGMMMVMVMMMIMKWVVHVFSVYHDDTNEDDISCC